LPNSSRIAPATSLSGLYSAICLSGVGSPAIGKTIGHVLRQTRIGTGDRPVATDADRARVRALLDAGEFPHLAAVFADERDITPPPDTFDTGLEWLFDGMQAVLDARRG
jgi:hypothetical protein